MVTVIMMVIMIHGDDIGNGDGGDGDNYGDNDGDNDPW